MEGAAQAAGPSPQSQQEPDPAASQFSSSGTPLPDAAGGSSSLGVGQQTSGAGAAAVGGGGGSGGAGPSAVREVLTHTQASTGVGVWVSACAPQCPQSVGSKERQSAELYNLWWLLSRLLLLCWLVPHRSHC